MFESIKRFFKIIHYKRKSKRCMKIALDIVYHLGYNNDEEIQEQLNIAKNRLYLASFIFDEKIDELNLPIGTNPDTDLILSEQFPKPSDTGEDD